MAYDKSKDEQLAERSFNGGKNKITVSTHRYDGGEVKVAISKYYKTKDDEWKWCKLGRMTVDQADQLVTAIQDLLGEEA